MDRPTSVTDREAEVLAQVAAGRSNAQISHALHISVRTVETHVSSLLRKLGASDRRELAEQAGPQVATPMGRPGSIVGLPGGRGTFVGRQADRDAVLAALDDHRLVSVVGPGGMGKTRLATVVASETERRFPAGAAFLDLVPVRPGLVVEALANLLGVAELPGQELSHTVAGRIGSGRFLLVLDNCEHLVDDVGAVIGDLLDHCPHLTVLATTRQRLGLPDERVVHLGPLPAEPDGVRLFLDRARAGDPDLSLDRAVVADICDHLDGMPLAIEIAAVRAASLGQDGLRAAIGDRLRLLRGARGVPARHASLDAVMSWSYDLLQDDERSMLRALSVFAGSFDLASAAAVSGIADSGATADLLGRLVDNSLVVRVTGAGSTRWRLLETVRAFADARIDEAERADLEARHLGWAIDTAAGLEDSLDGSWTADFDAVVDDLRAALARTSRTPDAEARRLARSLAHLAFARGHNREARQHYLTAAELTADDREAFGDIRDAAEVAIAGSDQPNGVDLLLRAAHRVEGRGNEAAVAWASAVENQIRFGYEYGSGGTPEQRSEWLTAARREVDPDDPAAAALITIAGAWHDGLTQVDLAEAALARARDAGDPVIMLRALDVLSATLLNTGRPHDALAVAEERLRLVGDLPRHRPAAATEISDTFHVAINIGISTGELLVAAQILERAEAEDPTTNPYVAIPRRIAVLTLTGRYAEAIEQGDELWHAWQRDRTDRRWLAPAFNLTALAHGLVDDGELDEWRSRTLVVARTGGAPTEWLTARRAFVDARMALHTGDLDEARTIVDDAFVDSTAWDGRAGWVYARAAGAELAVVAGLPDAEDRIRSAEPSARHNRWAAATLARARGRLLGSREELEAAETTYEQIGAEAERRYTLDLLAEAAEAVSRPDSGR